ncbi:hypothetical protein ARMGADRAFT_496457 [Armillaria gallica]|uniref:F-box domain-containing protein n=1 Tax=Armillaria gallica TaxID=47427 RepID=A0A2H3DVM6_ARMGA|nr:hypothetical protein ARMGADRAFT_496457 [Armillaria gallica]
MRHLLLSFELVSRSWKDVLDTFPNLRSYVDILIDRTPFSAYVCFFGICPALGSAHYRSRYAAVPTAPRSPVWMPFLLLSQMALFTVSRMAQTLHLCLHLSFPNLRELLLSSSETSEAAQHLYLGSLPSLRVFRATDVNNIDKLSLPRHQITHFTTMDEAGRGITGRLVIWMS